MRSTGQETQAVTWSGGLWTTVNTVLQLLYLDVKLKVHYYWRMVENYKNNVQVVLNQNELFLSSNQAERVYKMYLVSQRWHIRLTGLLRLKFQLLLGHCDYFAVKWGNLGCYRPAIFLVLPCWSKAGLSGNSVIHQHTSLAFREAGIILGSTPTHTLEIHQRSYDSHCHTQKQKQDKQEPVRIKTLFLLDDKHLSRGTSSSVWQEEAR